MPKRDISQKTIQLYLKEIEKYSDLVLTSEEEKELFKKIEKGDEGAKKQLAKAYLMLVVKIAQYYAPKTKKSTILDLIHEGNLGLFTAVEIYDWRSDYKFSTFATLVIRSAILRAVEDIKKSPSTPEEREKQRKIVDEMYWEQFYINKKGELVEKKLTFTQAEKKKRRMLWIHPIKKEDLSEVIDLVSQYIHISKLEAQQEIKKILQEK
jgi:RNA polymerase sigma factor (sigma-70 family)